MSRLRFLGPRETLHLVYRKVKNFILHTSISGEDGMGRQRKSPRSSGLVLGREV